MDTHVDINADAELIDRSLLQDSWTDILEHLPDAVFIVAAVGIGGRIKYLNLQATRMFGYERDELIDQSIEILVPQHLR